MPKIPWIFRSLSAMSVPMLFAASLAYGQAQPMATQPPQTLEAALQQMSDKAGVIFVGQVLSVHEESSNDSASGFVEIRFRIDQAILGCTAGSTYVLHEWSGLWSGGVQRYRVGQRLFMFLRAPAASGLSSPVDGLDGAIPIHGASLSLAATGAATQTYPTADLRWIEAKLLRPISYRTGSIHFNHRSAESADLTAPMLIAHAEAGSVHREDLSVITSPTSTPASTAISSAQQVSVSSIVAMLQSWQKARDETR